jgi:hypothetical protein
MAGVITTGSLPKLLWPGLNKIWGLTYEEWENGSEWKKIFPITQSDKNYEEDVGITGFGLAPSKSEGDSIYFDTHKQAFVTRYQNVTYALGYIITQEEIEDCQYAQYGAQRTRNLAFSMHQTRENVAANVLNRAFNASYTGGDGVSLLNSAHPLESGTFSNVPSFAVDLSEASLEQAAIDIEGFVDNRGNRIAIQPSKLIIPRQLQFEATRILKNAKNRPETANRDINAMYMMDTYPEGIVVNHYFTDPDAWFVQTNCPDGLKCFDRVKTDFADDNDFDTTNMKYRARARYSYGWTDPRGLYGSEGA